MTKLEVVQAERDEAVAREAVLQETLGEAIGLLGDFAGGYLSEDGSTVIESRGSMGRGLADVWPKAHALLASSSEAAQQLLDEVASLRRQVDAADAILLAYESYVPRYNLTPRRLVDTIIAYRASKEKP